MVPAVSIRISRVPTYSGYSVYYQSLHVQDFHLLWYDFPDIFHFLLIIFIRVVQPHSRQNGYGLGYSPFDRHYLGNHFCFLFLRVLRCFSSPGLLPDCSGYHAFNVVGCPIRKSADLMDICSSPQLIAACHVLLRLWEPRHSPYALINFSRIIILLIFLFITSMSKNFIRSHLSACGKWITRESNP